MERAGRSAGRSTGHRDEGMRLVGTADRRKQSSSTRSKKQTPRARTPKKAAPKHAAHGFTRDQVVLASLIGFMTVVGGLLWLLDGAPRPETSGLRLPALVASAGPNSLETVFDLESPIEPGRWQGIVIHHSASPHGSGATLDREHRDAGLNGLGYHFVIGNGNGAGDGELHVGRRWLEQTPGAHTAGPDGDWYNLNTIGICLVGDGDRRDFSPAQIQRLVQTVNELQRRLGVPASGVWLHRELAGTTSPGVRFPVASFREQLLP